MANDKLGFTFYPKDWWTSDTYFELNSSERYIYLECLFIMYSNDGFLSTDKAIIENRLRTQINPNTWDKITQKFVSTDLGYTHKSVNKRLKKSVTNRVNGQKGGRPPKPKEPSLETQNNPPLEGEREEESEGKSINLSVNWEKLLEQFNKITGKQIRAVSDKARRQIIARLKEGYSKDDVVAAITNCYNDEYHVGTGHKHLTIEFISRPDKMEKYACLNPDFKPDKIKDRL